MSKYDEYYIDRPINDDDKKVIIKSDPSKLLKFKDFSIPNHMDYTL